jgi:nicotinamide phosphoribosyltransferase
LIFSHFQTPDTQIGRKKEKMTSLDTVHQLLVFATDSYKFGGHWRMYDPGTSRIYSYFECRGGRNTTWEPVVFGIRHYMALLDKMYRDITPGHIILASDIAKSHLGTRDAFNAEGWLEMKKDYPDHLPIEISALPEGTVARTGVPIFTVTNTDPRFPWIVGYIESFLSHMWYPITVATLSRETKKLIAKWFEKNSDGGMIDYMLHDFGYRSASSHESATIGGAAHLINFKGTDTVPSILFVKYNYDMTNDADIAHSVPASEHSIMTESGPDGELGVVTRLIDEYPNGILSVVADSYNIYNFVENFVCDTLKEKIKNRDGVFVIRPDSVTSRHPDPASQVCWILSTLFAKFGGTFNKKGYKVIDPKVRVLWGDGIDFAGIDSILRLMDTMGFAAENIATFGMGGGLLQKVNRDTLSCAFKCSARETLSGWQDVRKNPIDSKKQSKGGRFAVARNESGEITCYPAGAQLPSPDLLELVYTPSGISQNALVTFSEIRDRAAI